MASWAKRILRSKKGEVGTISDMTEGADDKVPKFLDQIERSDPEKLKLDKKLDSFMMQKKAMDYSIGWKEKYYNE